MPPDSSSHAPVALEPPSSSLSFFCWACGVKLGVPAEMCGESGPCPECGKTVTAPGAKVVKKAAIHFLREEGVENPVEAPVSTTPLQVEVYEENERSQNILPGLLPKKVGDIILPAFIVIRRKPRWLRMTQTAAIIVAALLPMLWLLAFYFPEAKNVFSNFAAFRQRQLDFIERQIRSSREAQDDLDRKARMASSRPDKPQVRQAKQAVAAQTSPPPPPKPAEAPARPSPSSSTSSNSSNSSNSSQAKSSNSLAAPALKKPTTAAEAAAASAKTAIATQATQIYSSPYNPPPPEPYQLNSSASSLPGSGKPEWPQMLLRNNGMFAGHSPMRGACSFLVEGDGQSIWLATSSKLLGFEGGVAPPLSAEQLSEDLHVWRAFFPGDDSTYVDVLGGPALISVADSGWLALKLTKAPAELPSLPLKLRHNPPAAGELVYLVGLASDDRTGASQHMFAGRVTSSQQQDPAHFGVKLETPFKLDGFGGAPIVDLRGDLVGVLTGGRTSILICTKAERLETLIRGK